jgi:NAD(P)H-flavin reductase
MFWFLDRKGDKGPFTNYVYKRRGVGGRGIFNTVPLGNWLEKKKVTAIIIKQQFGFAMSTT